MTDRMPDWSDYEDMRLVELREQRVTHAEIGSILGRTEKAVEMRWRTLRKRQLRAEARAGKAACNGVPVRAPAIPRQWSPHEDLIIINLRSAGVTCAEIADRLGLTKQMVDHRWRRLRSLGHTKTVDDRRCKCGNRMSRWNPNDRCNACIDRARPPVLKELFL